MLCLWSHLSDHDIQTDVPSTNGQVVMMLILVTDDVTEVLPNPEMTRRGAVT